jgi:hypothetical protein
MTRINVNAEPQKRTRTKPNMSSVLQKLTFFLAVLSLPGAGCRHAQSTASQSAHREPKERPTIPLSAAEIRQKIAGTWQAEETHWRCPVTLSFGADGSFELTQPGRDPWRSTWRADRGFVIIMQGSSLPSDSLDYWAIWRVNDHELLFQIGMWSTAEPPERFRK